MTLYRTDPGGTHWSVSQCKNAGRCLRKWWLNRVGGFKDPDRPSTSLGKEVHVLTEAWLRRGESPGMTRPGQLARRLKDVLPAPPQAHVEEAYWLRDNGVLFEAHIDLWTPTTIYDHKTTAEWKWMSSMGALETDWQAGLYLAILRALGESPQTLQWSYVCTHRPDERARPVIVDAARVDTSMALSEMHEVIERAEAIRSWSWERVKKEVQPGDCSAFGGCPMAERCQLTAIQRIGAAMAQQSLKEKMEARAKAKGINPPAPTHQPPPVTPSVSQAPALDLEEPEAPAPAPTFGLELADAIEKALPKVPTPEPVKAPPPPAKPLVLLIDCVCVHSDRGVPLTVTLPVVLAPAVAEVEAELGVMWRMPQYAEGTNKLAAAVRALPLSGTILVDSFSPLWKAVGDELMARATMVMRGL